MTKVWRDTGASPRASRFSSSQVLHCWEFTIAQLPVTKRRREASVLLTVVVQPDDRGGSILQFKQQRFGGLVGAEALLLAGAIFDEIVFGRLGLLAGLLVGFHLAAI